MAGNGGTIVKRLGDGVMAAFADSTGAVEAALETRGGLGGSRSPGHRPRMRFGVHAGQPRRLGGDYFGVDVNVAARVMAAARPDQVLVSEPACADLRAIALPSAGPSGSRRRALRTTCTSSRSITRTDAMAARADLDLRFPEGFRWGVATSSHQNEGAAGRPSSTWARWEALGHIRAGNRSGLACDWWANAERTSTSPAT